MYNDFLNRTVSNIVMKLAFFSLILWRVGNSDDVPFVVKLKHRKLWVPEAVLLVIGSIWYRRKMILCKREPPQMPHFLRKPGFVVEERSLPHKARETIVFGIPFNVVQGMSIAWLLFPNAHQEVSQASPVRELSQTFWKTSKGTLMFKVCCCTSGSQEECLL